MNKELLIYFFYENWIIFACVFFVSIMTYTSFISSRFSALSPEQAIRLINKKAWLIDTREAEEFKKEHINGAENLPSATIKQEVESALKRKNLQGDILLCCANGTQSIPIIKKIKTLSSETKIHYIQGGMRAWKEAQYPVNKASIKKQKKK